MKRYKVGHLINTQPKMPDFVHSLVVMKDKVTVTCTAKYYANALTNFPHIDLTIQAASNPPTKPASNPIQNPMWEPKYSPASLPTHIAVPIEWNKPSRSRDSWK